MKANYNNISEIMEAVGNGSTRFRYNITESENGFNCDEVIIYGAITSDKVIAAFIAELWGNGVEQKLINDYNEFKLTGENPNAETAYIEFLSERKKLKESIHEII